MSRFLFNKLKPQKKIISKNVSNFFNAERSYVVNSGRFHENVKKENKYSSVNFLGASRSLSNENIIESPFPNVVIPNQNLVEYLFSDLEEDVMERPSVTCGSTGRSYNYGMMRFLISKFAQSVLSHCQMKPREVIGLLLPNIPEYVIVCHGAMEAGLPVTFVNPLYTANEIRRQFQNAEVKLIATVPQLLDVATEVGAQLVGYKGTICVGGDDDVAKKIFGLRSLLEADHEAELPGLNPRELAIIPYSSGTTGVPKGVMLSHYNLVANLVQIDHPEIRVDNLSGDPPNIFSVLPFFHIFGFNTILNSTLKLRFHLISLPRFQPEEYIKCLLTYKPSILFVVPSLVTFLTENSNVLREHLDSVEHVQSGAAPLTEGLMQRFRQKFRPEITIRQGYGMTEMSPVATSCPRNAPPTIHNTIGVVVSNTQGRIVDMTSGETLGPNKPGELQIKGPQVMMGYLNNDKATKETIEENGWLCTGDVAYCDSDDYVYIIDRCKELIKVKGNQVSPTELENLLLEIPEIADAAVVGIPDALAEEVPRAYVVKKPESAITDKDVLKYVNARVAHYKKLAGGVAFVDSIPRNPSGKILRNELKAIEHKSLKM